MNDRVPKRIKFLSIFLLAAAIFSLLAINTFAATADEIKEQNKALRTEKLEALFDLYMDNMNTSAVGSLVNNSLFEYIGRFNGITEEDLALESTSSIIKLYFEQGDSYNDVAWIYYTHYDSLDADGKEAADEMFATLRAEIDEAISAKELADKKHTVYANGGLCARMQVCIYSEKLDDLLVSADSERVQKKILEAKEQLKRCEDVELGTSDYDNILAAAKVSVDVQRKQDKAIEELDKVFAILYPETDLSQNDIYEKAFGLIDDDSCDDFTKINKVLCDSVSEAMDELASDGGKYENAFYEKLKQAVNDANSTAGNTGTADILPSLSGYGLQLEKACTKDDIADHINSKYCKDDQRLAEIEAEYNADGGLIDLAADSSAIAHEKNKATSRVDLYEQYADTLSAIRANRGDSADVSNIDKHYYDSDDLLKTATPENLSQRFGEAMAELEIEEFKAIFEDVLDMDINSVTVADKPAIEKAINALNSLNDHAKQDANIILASQKLTDLYKKIAKQEIAATLGTGDVREDYVDALDDMVDALSREDIATIIDDVDKIIDMAVGADKVLDRYDEITNTDDFAGFTDTEKSQMLATAKDACDAIISGTANIDDTANTAIVQLNREQAAARVEAKFREKSDSELPDVKENIAAIKQQALLAIKAESDPAKLESIANKAIFDIQKEFDAQDMIDSADALKAQINADPNLNDAQKKTLCDKLDSALSANVQALRAAKDEATKDAVISSFKKAEADIEDEQKTKSDAMKALTDRYNEVKDKISSLPKLSDEERSKLLADAEKTYTQSCKNIDKATALEVAAIESKAKSDLALTEAKAEAINKVQEEREKADSAIDALGYISEDQREAFKNAIEKAAEDAKDAINNASDIAAVEKAKNNATSSMNDTTNESIKKDAEAKEEQLDAAKEALDKKYQETIDLIDEKTYLSAEEKQALKDKALAALEEAKKKLDAATNTAQINKITSESMVIFEDQQEEVEDANNTAQQTQSSGAKNDLAANHKKTIDLINSLKYLDHSVREMLRSQADSVLANAELALKDAAGTDDIDRINAESEEQFENITIDAINADLETAKLRVSNELTAQKIKVENIVKEFKYLKDDKKDSLIGALTDELTAAHSIIASAPDVATVEKTREEVLDSMSKKHDEAIKMEDDACVDLLRPILISLCAVGIAEAVAILLLLKKKRTRAAELAGFVPLGLMAKSLGSLPTTMWILTIIMAVADVLMAIFIIYLVIWLRKNKNAPEQTEEEEEDVDDSFLYTPELEIEPPTDEEPTEEVEEELPVEEEAPAEEEPIEEEPIEEEPVEEEPVEEEPVEEEPEIVVVPELEAETEEEPEEEPEEDTDEEEVEDEVENDDDDFFTSDREYRRVTRTEPVRRPRGKRYKKIPKSVVNVDTLEKNFAANDTVSIEILKQRQIISQNTEKVKILGRGQITKPLTVVMPKFSGSAIGKILEAGGSVMIERKGENNVAEKAEDAE